MKIYRLLLGILLLVMLLASIAWWISYSPSRAMPGIWGGRFVDLKGNVKPISRPHQRPLVINFWATWCEPCREEMADLMALAKALQGKVDFMGIAVDNVAAVREFLGTIKTMPYPILLGQADVLALMKSEGNEVGGLPFTVVYNAEGERIATICGKIQKTQLHALLLRNLPTTK